MDQTKVPQKMITDGTRPLRILEVVDTLDAGGMEAQLVALMNRLDPERFQFHVASLRHPGVYAERLRGDIRLTALGKSEGFQPSAALKLHHLMRMRFDLIHTHNWPALVYASLASFFGRIAPILHGEHSQLNDAELTTKRLLLRRLLYRTCRSVHTVSAGQREELIHHRLHHPRLVALINGVDTCRFRPADRIHIRNALGLPLDARLIGIVARFGTFKRHLALLEAFEALASKYPDVHLLMVGDGGPQKNAVTEAVARCAFGARIILAGHQPDPVPWYQALDLLAVPSSNEGLSNATMEAMSCGVPVLSNNICGARELIGEDEGGWVRDLSTIEKLTASLDDVLSMPKAAFVTKGDSARSRIESRFSWDGMAEAYARSFMDCARARP
jgi:glycosyltransferase involved in cell wall biosynthesis